MNTITLQELPVSFYRDILHIKILDEFDVDLCLTFLSFWNRSCSNGSILQLLVNKIMYQNLPASCCKCSGSDVLFIRISTRFDLDLCVTFLPLSPYRLEGYCRCLGGRDKLCVSCCNFIGMFSTSKSRTSLTLTFVWPFWTFKVAHGQVTLWTR